MTTDAPDHDQWDPEREEAEAEAHPDRGKRLWWILGGLAVVIGSAMAIWFGVASSEDSVTTTDIGYEEPTATEIVMVFDVTRPTGTVVSCTVTAMDREYGRVGTVEHEVAASDERTTRVRAPVRTTTEAVTATVQGCTAID